ncbi:MAG: hypothetical protein RE469_06965 [Cuniculiplasma divulgatum]|jgi:hypothetical protein|nr:MAG: hypothetical protein RE469_06965 [Cuniculiplasma divulgatum]
MVSSVIALRIDDNTSDLIDKLIKYKLATSKADALRWTMQNGMQSAKKTVERKEKSQAIIRVWKERGLPKLPNDLSESSIKDRD